MFLFNQDTFQVFLSAEPKHWCSQPQLDLLAPDLELTHRLHLGSPLEREDGESRLYSRCTMYSVNWTNVLNVSCSVHQASKYSLKLSNELYFILNIFVYLKLLLLTCALINYWDEPLNLMFWCTQENGGVWPEHPDTNWTVTACDQGWTYDRSEFKNTLVTEVGCRMI